MNLQKAGNNILTVEVTNISRHGIWLLVDNQEFFMPYSDFPWFKEAKILEVLNVEQLQPEHFYWPELDVDLSIEMITHPERFPLVSTTCQSNLSEDMVQGRKEKM